MDDVQLLHLDKRLTNFAVGYSNEEAIADQVLPGVASSKQSDKFYVFNKEGFIPESDDLRAPGSAAHEIPGATFSTSPFFTQEHALEIGVPDEEKQNADDLNPQSSATDLVVDRLIVGREKKVADLIRTTGSYASGHTTTLSGSNQWSDASGGDPLGVAKTARDTIHGKTGRKPNVMWMGYQVFSSLAVNTKLEAKIRTTTDQFVTLDLMKRAFEVEVILVGSMIYNTANQNATESLDYVWGKDAGFLYQPNAANLTSRLPAFGRTFWWDYNMGGRKPVERYRDEKRIRDIVRTRFRYDNVISSNTSGYLVKAAVA